MDEFIIIKDKGDSEKDIGTNTMLEKELSKDKGCERKMSIGKNKGYENERTVEKKVEKTEEQDPRVRRSALMLTSSTQRALSMSNVRSSSAEITPAESAKRDVGGEEKGKTPWQGRERKREISCQKLGRRGRGSKRMDNCSVADPRMKSQLARSIRNWREKFPA